ncbi:MAG: ectoine/hydroxyectoine ABC transporter permease subunit EhuC [Clostridiales bacterium]|nr:ectoine/hydroxyectoine ABC transporter permease subunit EhuC [Clostridiales bacterium]
METDLWALVRGILRGLGVTLEVYLLGALLALVVSLVVALMRLSSWKSLRGISTFYVEFIRGTSLLVQLFWIFYALPVLLGISMSALAAGVLGLTLNYGAYGSEVVRGAIQAIDKGQTEAAIALNMGPALRLRRIILPQAWPVMLPSLGNLLIELLKGTSLVSLITLSDLTFQGMSLRTTYARDELLIFGILLVIYFTIALLSTLFIRYLERRAAVGRG